MNATAPGLGPNQGLVVEGPMVAIVAALMGRPAVLDHLSGPGVEAARGAMAAERVGGVTSSG